MHKPDLFGMQALSLQTGDSRAVHIVSVNGMPDVAHMYPDLMGAPGFQPTPDMSMLCKLGQHCIMGHRMPGIFLRHAHFLPIRCASADGSIHRARRLPEPSAGNGFIFPGKAVAFDLLRQMLMGKIRFRHHQQTAGVFVDPVHDTGTDHPVDGGQSTLAVIQQGIHQCAVRMPCRRMHHHALGLVHHQQGFILVYDLQRQVLGLYILQWGRIRDLHQQAVPFPELQILCRRFPVAKHCALLDQMLHPGTTQLRQLLCKPFVQPHAAAVSRQHDLTHGVAPWGIPCRSCQKACTARSEIPRCRYSSRQS